MGVSAYDEIAEWYDTWIGGDATGGDQIFSAVETLLGDVRGLRVCDLACGQGKAARCLADRGAQVVGVDVRTVSGYFTEGFWRSDTRPGPPGKVGAYHRMLSTYVNALLAVGLPIERMVEPRLTGHHAERRPVWTEVPGALAVRCRKGRIA